MDLLVLAYIRVKADKVYQRYEPSILKRELTAAQDVIWKLPPDELISSMYGAVVEYRTARTFLQMIPCREYFDTLCDEFESYPYEHLARNADHFGARVFTLRKMVLNQAWPPIHATYAKIYTNRYHARAKKMRSSNLTTEFLKILFRDLRAHYFDRILNLISIPINFRLAGLVAVLDYKVTFPIGPDALIDCICQLQSVIDLVV